MWTHKHCFSKKKTTSDSIKENAELKIAQSLKFGRTIAFTGAGVSAAYGHLSWEEVAQFIVLDTLDVFSKFLEKNKDKDNNYSDIKELVKEIKTIVDPDDSTEPDENFDLPSIHTKINDGLIQLCRDVLKLISIENKDYCPGNSFNNLELDDTIRQLFNGDSTEIFKARLRLIDYRLYNLFDSIIKNGARKAVKVNSISYLKLEMEFLGQIESVYTIHDNEFPEKQLIPLLQEIYEGLTPQYKIESNNPDPYHVLINKLRLSRFVTTNYDSEIENIFDQQGYDDKPQPEHNTEHTKIMTNGYGETLISRAPTDDSVGDLLVFSSTTLESNASLYHLHGSESIAKTKRLVISEEDYQEQYLKGTERRIVFDEGLRTLFGGNDILFIGSGMSEEDLLRPLRQYLAERPKFPRQLRTLVALKSYKKKNKLRADTLSMKYRYNVDIIGYDDGTNNLPGDNPTPSDDPPMHSRSERCAAVCCRTERNYKQAELLTEQLKELYKKSYEWWQAWQQRPASRMACWRKEIQGEYVTVYRYEFEQPITDKTFLDNYFKAIGTICKKDISDSLALQNSDYSRRILRFSSPGGRGKGNFNQLLQSDINRGNLFQDKSEYIASFFADAYFSTEFNSTISAFGKFLLDTIERLIKEKDRYSKLQAGDFAKKMLRLSYKYEDNPELIDYLEHGNPYDRNRYSKILSESINQNPGLLRMLTILFGIVNGLLKNGERIFVCISDLDRICDIHGYAYSPLHRAAFKLLAGDPLKAYEGEDALNLKYDLVVISDEPQAPIRYLSDYKNAEPWLRDLRKDSQSDLTRWIRFPDRNSIDQCIKGELQNDNMFDDLPDKFNNFLNQNNYFRYLFELYINQINHDKEVFKDVTEALSYIIWGEELEHHKLIGVLLDAYAKLGEKCKFPGRRKIQVILKHLALFSYPIDKKILKICPDVSKIFKNEKGKFNIEKLDTTCSWLVENGFIFSIEDKFKTDSNRYAIHRMVRDFLAYQMDYGIYDRDEHSFFDVTIFAEQPRDLPSPRYKDYESIQKILNALNKEATKKLHYLSKEEIKDAKGNLKEKFQDIPSFLETYSDSKPASEFIGKLIEHIRLVRASIHLMDTAFSIGVISRMDDYEFSDLYEMEQKVATPYESYCDTASSLICNAVRVDTTLKTLTDDYKKDLILEGTKIDYRELRVFYPTQIAWLYNERAVTRFMQGRLFECLPLFDLAIETLGKVNWSTKARSSNNDLYKYPENSSLRRVLLNKAVAQIEFGQLDNAETMLRKLHKRCENMRQRTSCTGTLAGAYLGLCHHIRGSYIEARKHYEKALDVLNSQHGRERSKALIYKFLGDLDRVENKLDESLNHLELAANLADTVQQRDIYHQVRVSFAKLHIRQGNYAQAIEILNDTELYARKLGIPKLLVDCWLVRGLVNLLEKQTTIAGEYLSHAIATANRNGMVMYKVAALHLYCNVLDTRDTPESQAFVQSIRKAAKTRSERIGYPFKIQLKNPVPSAQNKTK